MRSRVAQAEELAQAAAEGSMLRKWAAAYVEDVGAVLRSLDAIPAR